MMRSSVIALLAWVWVGASVVAGVRAEDLQTGAANPTKVEGRGAVILQILGRRCEYHRDEVEAVLRRQGAVEAVTFLNNHGTVLIRYRPEMVTSNQLAAAIEQVLPIGVGCRVRVE